MRMRSYCTTRLIIIVTLAVGLQTPALGQATAPTATATFPRATPESQGMSTEALSALVDAVRGFQDRDLFVGAELVIIKNRHIVLQETFGFSDLDDETAWKPNTICNIRSMSKPFTGAAAQILIDRGVLALDAAVADYIPAFDNDAMRGITIEHLLTHQSGLPLTAFTVDLNQFQDLQAIAASLGETELRFEPGTQYWYSDAGTDTLGAVVEKLSGMLLDEFVMQELIEPLGMNESFYVFTDDEPHWDRVASLYMGGPNAWTRFWTPDGGALYPFAWGSQTIYSTPIDYARFLCMWMDGGRALDGTQILSTEAVTRTLTPAAPMGMLGSDRRFPTDFSGLETYYGQMSVLHVPTSDPAHSSPVVIGHSGSDGTVAWAWPEDDLMVLFFTQSRGGMGVLRIEDPIDRLILHPERNALAADVPAELQPFLGTYIANFATFDGEAFEVLFKNGRLALDVPSQMVFELDDPDEQGRRSFVIAPQVQVSFERDENGEVHLLKMYQGSRIFDVPRKGTPLAAEQAKRPVVDPEAVSAFLGMYDDPTSDNVVELFLDGETFCIRSTGERVVFHLRATSDASTFEIKQVPGILIRFNVDESGDTASLTRIQGENTLDMPRVRPDQDRDDDGDDGDSEQHGDVAQLRPGSV